MQRLREAGAGTACGKYAMPADITRISDELRLSRGTPGRIRTCDLPLRRRMLFPLSYWGMVSGEV